MLIWKRVGVRAPLASEPRKRSRATGTTTSRRVFDALRGRTRTVLPSLAREKKTRLWEVPRAKFLPLSTTIPLIGTWAGENEVTVGLGVPARAADANAQSAMRARAAAGRRRRIPPTSAVWGIP